MQIKKNAVDIRLYFLVLDSYCISKVIKNINIIYTLLMN